MKKILVVLLIASACRGTGQDRPGETLSPIEFQQKLAHEVVLIDVRTPEEYSSGFIAGAANMDVKSPSFDQRLDSLNKVKTYLVYCASGARSDRAAKMMRARGFTSVVTLEGGIAAWSEGGLPVKKP